MHLDMTARNHQPGRASVGKRRQFASTLIIGMMALFLHDEALCASVDASRPMVVGGWFWVTAAIVYFSRKRCIGGWLLYFYVQLYANLLVSLLLLPRVVSNLNPEQWGDSLLYVMFFLSVVPVALVEFLAVFVATRLLLRRNKENAIVLRKTLMALVAASAVAVAIDAVYFRDDVILDVIGLLFWVIWIAYFLKARRVQEVFIDHIWAYTSHSRRRALSADDRKRLRKRALIASVASFAFFLLLMGSVLNDEGEQPDLGIFTVPVFYAAVAAIVAWYLPIRKRSEKEDGGNVLGTLDGP